MEGRVEICYYNQWGTICDDSWDSTDAGVICGQLGYSSTGKKPSFGNSTSVSSTLLLFSIIAIVATAYSRAHFGAGAGPIVMDDVGCTGSENSLTNCSFTLNHNCGHTEDAGVRCTSSTTGINYTTNFVLWISETLHIAAVYYS